VLGVSLADLVPEEYRAAGLTLAELDAVQEQTGTAFPPDLCELLMATLPTGRGFPDWRTRARETLAAFREQLIDGIEFDAVHNDVWVASWGDRPTNSDEVREVISQQVRDAPVLIPLYSHRALPNEPLEPGNPIFSVHQTDVIVYGSDLGDYLLQEFHPGRAKRAARRPRMLSEIREIRFWTQLLDTSD
jgi:hypothetical protein